MGYRVAFASIDGASIDQHFGAAHYWQIYDINAKGVFIETRKTAAKCRGHCEGGFEHLLAMLRDCDAVFVSKIGPQAATFMISKGKRVFEAAGEVNEIISQLIEQDLLKESG